MNDLTDLSFLGAFDIDLAFVYLSGYAAIKENYTTLTEGGRGGQIAYTLVRDKNQKVMEDWVLNLQPQAFGPLLLTLSAPPSAFSVEEDQDAQHFSADQAQLMQ